VEGTGPELISDALVEFSSKGLDRPRQRNARRSSAEIPTTFWADGLACLSDPMWHSSKQRLALGFAGDFEYLLSRNAVPWLRLMCLDWCGLDWCAQIIVMCVCVSCFALMQLLLWQGCPTLDPCLFTKV